MKFHPCIGMLYRMFLYCKECDRKTWHDLYGSSMHVFEYRCEYKHGKDGATQNGQNNSLDSTGGNATTVA